MKLHRHLTLGGKLFVLTVFILSLFFHPSYVFAESAVPQQDQTPLSPLINPGSSVQPRYISGFGSDNVYTVFFENRADTSGCTNPEAFRIYFTQTTTGAMGFSAASTATNICDTHFTAKNWPITIGATTYAYRGWGAQGNNPNHAFYVSNDMVNWTQIYVGTGMFTDPGGVLLGDTILYGFHDIVQINGHYMGFVESAGGITYIARSDAGDEHWTLVARVGGAVAGASPLNLYFSAGITGPIPSGNFMLMEVNGELVYGKLMIPGDRRGAYLAVNAAAAQAATPALAEAAFLNPANWTWQDGTTGLPGTNNLVLNSTYSLGGHDIREAWMAPNSDPASDYVILYTARYASGSVVGIGCAAANDECLVVVAPDPVDPGTTPDALPATGFAPHRVTTLGIQPQELTYTGTGMYLEIPSLGVDVPVVGIPQSGGGWDVTWLGSQAGYLQGTAYPTWNGNSGISAHVYNADGTPGPFVNLGSLRYGDRVIIHAWGQEYVYEVRLNELVAPDDLSVLRHEEFSWLTLLTCQGYDESSDSYYFRRAVRAVLVQITDEP